MESILKSVYYTGAPLHVTERQLRSLFSQCGHISSFRPLPARDGADFQSGYVDYTDAKSVDDAIESLNGHKFESGHSMKVSVSRPKRPRAAPDGSVMTNGAPWEFRRGFVNLVLPGDRSIEQALRKLPVGEAYEAVEQLRILALERPDDARVLLDHNPHLSAAVVLILQHAGKLPLDQLPEEAFAAGPPVPSPLCAPDKKGEGAALSSGPSANVAAAPVQLAPEIIDKVVAVISKMTPKQVNDIKELSDENLQKIKDAAKKAQISWLRTNLRIMDAML